MAPKLPAGFPYRTQAADTHGHADFRVFVGASVYKFNDSGEQYAGEKPFPAAALAKIDAWNTQAHTFDSQHYIQSMTSTPSGIINAYEANVDYFNWVQRGSPNDGNGPGISNPLDPNTYPNTLGVPNPFKTFSNIADAITALVSALFDPAFWLRALETVIGVVVVGATIKELTK